MTEIDWLTLTPYFSLLLSVLFCLFGRREQLVAVFLLLAVVLGFFTGRLTGLGLGACLVLPVTLFVWVNHFFAEILRNLAFLAFLVIGYLMASHSLPGFDNFKIFDQLVFSQGSAPFDMWLNFDKVYFATVLFIMLPKLERQVPFKASLFLVLRYYLVALFVLLPLAWFSGYIKFQMNTNAYVLIWALNNLFFVCFSEEVIFRRFIQNRLVHYFRVTQYGDVLAVVVGAVIFGLAHFAGGFVYVGLSIVAGLIYGFCFYHSCNVRSSMLLHFLVNLTHVLFFTYPMSA